MGNSRYKFRAWIKKEKRMDNVDFINFAAQFTGKWECKPNDLFDVATKRGRLFNLEDVEIMQYTGLKDKNGKEIYEGDIISIKADYLSEFNSESILPCEIVAFEDGAFGTYDKKRTLFVSFKEMIDKSDGIEFEIIGNVFEDPGLLEDENAKWGQNRGGLLSLQKPQTL